MFSKKYNYLTWKYCLELRAYNYLELWHSTRQEQMTHLIQAPLFRIDKIDWSEFHQIYLPNLSKAKENVAILERNHFFEYSHWFKENRKRTDAFLLRKSKVEASHFLWGIHQSHIITGQNYPWLEKINKAILTIEVYFEII